MVVHQEIHLVMVVVHQEIPVAQQVVVLGGVITVEDLEGVRMVVALVERMAEEQVERMAEEQVERMVVALVETLHLHERRVVTEEKKEEKPAMMEIIETAMAVVVAVNSKAADVQHLQAQQQQL